MYRWGWGSLSANRSLRDVIKNAFPGQVEDVNFSPLPLNYKDVKKGSIYSVTTYCIRCRKETVHVIRAVSGNRFNPDGIYIDCQECRYPMYFGHVVHYFFKTDCPSCGRKTVHALYEERGGLFRAGALVAKCLGCGRQTVLGR